MSKNAITAEQIYLACRHVEELLAAGVTENLAIRTLELFVDVFATIWAGGSATPHHVSKVKLWSIRALELLASTPNARPQTNLRVEHGTPRRTLARRTMALYREDRLNAAAMESLVSKLWKLAVITLEEDKALNKLSKTTFETPDDRWAAAGIKFPDHGGC
jgi:hypothetical protein